MSLFLSVLKTNKNCRGLGERQDLDCTEYGTYFVKGYNFAKYFRLQWTVFFIRSLWNIYCIFLLAFLNSYSSCFLLKSGNVSIINFLFSVCISIIPNFTTIKKIIGHCFIFFKQILAIVYLQITISIKIFKTIIKPRTCKLAFSTVADH